MSIVVVPAGAVPGDFSQAVKGPDICDLWPAGGIPPAGWVGVSIQPLTNGAGSGPVTPDSHGQFLHLLVRFARPKRGLPDSYGQVDKAGKRREHITGYSPTGIPESNPIQVETDPGSYWIGTDAEIYFIGGTPGDRYEVTACAGTVRQEVERKKSIDLMEPPFVFSLTSIFAPEGGTFVNFPALPLYHQWLEVVQGFVKLAGVVIPLDASYGPGGRIPLNIPTLSVSTGIYRTGGSF